MTATTSQSGPRRGVEGTVERFDAEVGLGIVVGDDGSTFGFHCTEIADGSRTIDPGVAVRFDVGPAGPGVWEAMSVTPR